MTQASRPGVPGDVPRLDARGYVASHEAFRDYSDQRQMVMEWFGQSALLEGAPLEPSVLSVGSGGGDVDVELVRALGERGRFSYDAVDPNRVALERFRERVEALPPAHTRQVWMHHGRFEGFEPGHRYDLIHFVHAIYSMSDVGSAVGKAYRLLEDGGKIGIVCSTNGGVNRFKESAFAAIGRRAARVSLPESKLLHSLSDLEDTSLQIGMIPSQINVEPCFARLPVGDRILSFFLQCDFSALGHAEQEAVIGVLRKYCSGSPGSRSLAQPMLGIALSKERTRSGRRTGLQAPTRRQIDELADVAVLA